MSREEHYVGRDSDTKRNNKLDTIPVWVVKLFKRASPANLTVNRTPNTFTKFDDIREQCHLR